jgi:Autophagocytosis associated protein, active-site domain
MEQAMPQASELPKKDSILVEFSVLLSQTYQVPVLWFTLIRLPPGVSNGIDTVYRHLVPATREFGLLQTGVMGGISIAVCSRGSCMTCAKSS